MELDTTIRPYQGVDRSSVVALWDEVFPDEPEWHNPALIIRRKLTVQPDLFLVAVAGSQLVGTVMAGYDGVRGRVHHVAVHPRVRRNGVGRALMACAEQRLPELGCPKLNLQVRAANASVLSFYSALGYSVEDLVSFGKRLEQAE